MKKKIISLLAIAIMVSYSVTSQTVKDNVDKLAKDKNTAERAAKADVLMHKKIIFDSTQNSTTPSSVLSKSTVAKKEKYKKHKHKMKTKKSS